MSEETFTVENNIEKAEDNSEISRTKYQTYLQ